MADKPLAEKAATWQREAELAGRDQDMPKDPPAPELAQEDVLIERPDLGDNAATLVAAGDAIPRELADRPRRPATEAEPQTKRRR